METQDYGLKGKVLVSRDYSNVVMSTLIDGKNLAAAGIPFYDKDNFNEGLVSGAELQAKILFRGKVGFGDYQVLNGKYHNLSEDKIIPAGKADARTLSIINFAILNEMFRLTQPQKLEGIAA